MTTQVKQEKQKAIFVLEDQERVREVWIEAFRQKLPGVHVFGTGRLEDSDRAIQQAERQGYEIVLAIVDQVLQEDREAGERFLRGFKESHPNAQRVMFSGQSERDEIQRFLDEKLIHHFQSKSAFASETDLPEKFLEKVKEMVSGPGRGNVSDPDFRERFRRELQDWMKALPQGEETRITDLNGQSVRAGDLLKDEELVSALQDGYLTSRLDALF